MHTYPWHVGDFLKDCAHLSDAEELAYRRLMDLYYTSEQPIPNRTQWVAKRIRMVGQEKVVGSILREFFTLEGDDVHGLWRQKRCDAEITKYQKRVVTNQENGRKRVSKPTGIPLGYPMGSKPEPRTNKDTPIPPEGVRQFDSFWNAYPRKEAKPLALRAFAKALGLVGRKPARGTFDELMAGLAVHVTCKQWTKDGGEFVPLAATWLNQDRWNDRPLQPGDADGGEGWWNTRSGLIDKALELGIPAPAENDPMGFIRFRASVWVKAGDGPWWDDKDVAYPYAVKMRDEGGAGG